MDNSLIDNFLLFNEEFRSINGKGRIEKSSMFLCYFSRNNFDGYDFSNHRALLILYYDIFEQLLTI